ncbi:MAG: hypothetical protein RJB60_2296 [Pseudomonadota bacterium]|jgi:hypothetical protein
MSITSTPHTTGIWLLRCVVLLMLAGVFAWYFLGPVPFDLNRLWAFCAAR